MPGDPLKRPIGLRGVLRFVIAASVVIAIGAAAYEGRWALAAATAVLLGVVAWALWMRRSR